MQYHKVAQKTFWASFGKKTFCQEVSKIAQSGSTVTFEQQNIPFPIDLGRPLTSFKMHSCEKNCCRDRRPICDLAFCRLAQKTFEQMSLLFKMIFQV